MIRDRIIIKEITAMGEITVMEVIMEEEEITEAEIWVVVIWAEEAFKALILILLLGKRSC
jgi:hypothetical protein